MDSDNDSPASTERSVRSESGDQSDASSVASSTAPRTRKRRRSRRREKQSLNPSIYDLIAGNVRQPSRNASYDGRTLTKPFPPSEWYFERKRVKTGDENEDDRLYWLPDVDKHELPPSDLLWAIYHHASQYYAEQGQGRTKFMDESALLAMGILMEETMKQELGATGHLALLESDDEAIEDDSDHQSEGSAEIEPDSSLERVQVREAHKRKRKASSSHEVARKFTKDDFLTDSDD